MGGIGSVLSYDSEVTIVGRYNIEAHPTASTSSSSPSITFDESDGACGKVKGAMAFARHAWSSIPSTKPGAPAESPAPPPPYASLVELKPGDHIFAGYKEGKRLYYYAGI